MTSSGMLSTADKLTSNIITKDSTWQKCVFDQAFHISTSPGTHSNEWMHIHAIHKHTFAHVCERILTSDILQRTLWSSLHRTSYLCWVFPSNLHVGFHPNITLCVFLILMCVCVCAQCVLMLSVSSKKTHHTSAICIQTESSRACSATVPVCLKSAKAL